jgi:hypothetical protein
MKRNPNWKVAVAITVFLAVLLGCGIAANGEPGVGIDYIVNNGDGTFTIYLTDGSSHTTDNFTGPQGLEGPAGPGFDELVSATVTPDETTSNTTYTDLSTPGPSVTTNITSGKALVIITARVNSPSSGGWAYMSFAVSDASTVPPYDVHSLGVGTNSANLLSLGASATYVVTGLTNGSNTFTAKYRASGGTCSFSCRRITVVPLP